MGQLSLAQQQRPSAACESSLRDQPPLRPPGRTGHSGSHVYLRPSQVPVARTNPRRGPVNLLRSLERSTSERTETAFGLPVSDPADQSERAAEAAASAVMAGTQVPAALQGEPGC